jgi:hypothetical protein
MVAVLCTEVYGPAWKLVASLLGTVRGVGILERVVRERGFETNETRVHVYHRDNSSEIFNEIVSFNILRTYSVR